MSVAMLVVPAIVHMIVVTDTGMPQRVFEQLGEFVTVLHTHADVPSVPVTVVSNRLSHKGLHIMQQPVDVSEVLPGTKHITGREVPFGADRQSRKNVSPLMHAVGVRIMMLHFILKRLRVSMQSVSQLNRLYTATVIVVIGRSRRNSDERNDGTGGECSSHSSDSLICGRAGQIESS